MPQAFCDGGLGKSQEPPWPSGCSGHCQAAVLWREEREGSSCPPSPPQAPTRETGRAGPPFGLQQGEAVFSSVDFPCPSLSSGQLPCVTAPPCHPLQRMLGRPVGQACLLVWAPWHGRGRAAREPIRFEKHPSCMCFCSGVTGSLTLKHLFVKEKKPSEFK